MDNFGRAYMAKLNYDKIFANALFVKSWMNYQCPVNRLLQKASIQNIICIVKQSIEYFIKKRRQKLDINRASQH